MNQQQRTPLCVDLDGTLIHTDILLETLLILLKRNPFWLFVLPFWLLKGKAYFKHQLAVHVDLNITLLPFNQPLLDYLRIQHQHGRHLILATAANIKYAQQIAEHLGLFETVLASDCTHNLSGKLKRDCLVRNFGAGAFIYAGNAHCDLTVWNQAAAAIIVNAKPKLMRQVEAVTQVEKVFAPAKINVTTYLKALRIHQWVKNLLIFIPLAAAHQVLDLKMLSQTMIAFCAFGCCASSVYLLNDLLDLEADRQHPSKQRRPFAAGLIPLQQGLLVIPTLLLVSFIATWWLPLELLKVLGVYYVLTLIYSWRLKQWMFIDVLVLAGLYTLRIIAGGAATSIPLSFWLLAFSMFLFLSLALVKRYSELLLHHETAQATIHGRGYRITDLETLAQFGITSGYLAVLVLALYIDNPTVSTLYTEPEMLWLLCPALLYWISRIWLLARRSELHEDPVVFALTDYTSYGLFLLMASILWLAS